MTGRHVHGYCYSLTDMLLSDDKVCSAALCLVSLSALDIMSGSSLLSDILVFDLSVDSIEIVTMSLAARATLALHMMNQCLILHS